MDSICLLQSLGFSNILYLVGYFKMIDQINFDLMTHLTRLASQLKKFEQGSAIEVIIDDEVIIGETTAVSNGRLPHQRGKRILQNLLGRWSSWPMLLYCVTAILWHRNSSSNRGEGWNYVCQGSRMEERSCILLHTNTFICKSKCCIGRSSPCVHVRKTRNHGPSLRSSRINEICRF